MKVLLDQNACADFVLEFEDEAMVTQNQPWHGWMMISSPSRGTQWLNAAYVIGVFPSAAPKEVKQ